MDTLAALVIVAAAVGYLAARFLALARGEACGGGCGAKDGCPALEERLRDLTR